VGREHYNHNYVQLVQGNPVILRGLKNYGAEWNKVSMSVRDIFVYNVPVYQNAASTDAIKGAVFVFDLGTLCIVHLGDLAHTLTPEQVKQIGKVDVALTPIDGSRTMPPDIAREVLGQLKPKISIPMHYRDNAYLIREFTKGLKAQIMKTDTLVVSKGVLPASLEIRVLQPRGAMGYE
jgi:L-ascorbate metabolism protein UlaG (beta-lactamase superfamily)